MNDIKNTIIKIKKIAKLNNKISCVFLGNTVQKEKTTFYITPIRENKKLRKYRWSFNYIYFYIK